MSMKIENIYRLFLECSVVSTDTRKIELGCMFFALKGDNFNGNKFASKAIELGASYSIVDESKFVVSNKTILVEDVLTTLQELASFHRDCKTLQLVYYLTFLQILKSDQRLQNELILMAKLY